MKKGIIVGIILIVIIVVGYFVLMPPQNESEKNVIKFGVIMPLTGPVAEPGTNALRGIEIAVDDFNNNNRQQIELIVEDSKSNPTDGTSAIHKLIDIDKVKIVIGDIMSSVILATAPIAEKKQVIMISPGGSNPDIREAGDYIFRIYPSDDYDGQVMAEYIFKKLDYVTTAVINVNNDYGIGVRKTFVSKYKELGGTIILNEEYLQGQTDFRNTILKIKNGKPDVIYIIGNPAENGNIVKQLKELNVNIPLTGNLSFENEEFIEIARGAFDSIIFSAPYFNISSDEKFVKEFVQKYQSNNGEKMPDVAASLGYDVAKILISVLANNNFSIPDLKDDLYEVENFEGITGRISFDSKGDVVKDIFIKIIDGNGKIDVIEIYSLK